MRGGPSPSSYHNPIKLRRAFGGKDPTRVHTRHPCEVPVAVWSWDAKTKLGQGKFTNIGVGGALLHCSFNLEKNLRYQFQVGRGRARVVLHGRVVRLHPIERSHPYDLFFGILFDLTAVQEKEIREGLARMRHPHTGPSIPDEKLKWYWWL